MGFVAGLLGLVLAGCATRSIEVTVTGRDGGPVRGASVKLLDELWQGRMASFAFLWAKDARTNRDGVATFRVDEKAFEARRDLAIQDPETRHWWISFGATWEGRGSGEAGVPLVPFSTYYTFESLTNPPAAPVLVHVHAQDLRSAAASDTPNASEPAFSMNVAIPTNMGAHDEP